LFAATQSREWQRSVVVAVRGTDEVTMKARLAGGLVAQGR
jgi:hypothetical protein